MNELNRDTLKLLQSVLDEAWSSLRPEEQARIPKTQIGAYLLELAASGERDPVRLRKKAIAEVVACATPE
jgi:hypothetical protein